MGGKNGIKSQVFEHLTFQPNFQVEFVLAEQQPSFGLANSGREAFNGSDLSRIRIFLHVSTLISMMLSAAAVDG